jgi:hypothetical protein
MDLQTLRRFEARIQEMVPGFRVAFKDKSVSQKVIGFFVRPFNPTYMTKYISTFYPVVYFPTQEHYESNPRSSFTILAHELVHLLDTRKHPLWFRLSYLFPQVLSLVAFAVYASLVGWRAYPVAILLAGLTIGCALAPKSMGAFWAFLLVGGGVGCTLAILVNGWLSIPFFVGLGLLAPWPAPGRVHWEVRGYTVNLAMMIWLYGMAPSIIRETLIRHFIRADYYFMSWNRTAVEAVLDQQADKIVSDAILKETPYDTVAQFLKENGEIHG